MTTDATITSHALPTGPVPSHADADARETAGEPCCSQGDAEPLLQTERSECPSPLMWADVLTRVEEGVSETRFDRAGGRVTVRSFGEGRPLYVLPGALGDWKLFSLTMWLLRDEFRTVVVDPPIAIGHVAEAGSFRTDAGSVGHVTEAASFRGRGRSWQLVPRLTAEQLAADLFAAADRQGDERFCLFATSLGTLPAMQAMLERPSRIERAVLHAADSRLRMSATERLLAFLGRFVRRPLQSLPFFTRIQFHNHRRWFPPFDASRWEFLLANIGRTPTAELCRRLAGLKAADLSSRLSEINTPVVLLHAEGEGAAGERRSEALQAALPAAATRFLPHCGHFPFLTHPHLLAKAVKEVVSGRENNVVRNSFRTR